MTMLSKYVCYTVLAMAFCLLHSFADARVKKLPGGRSPNGQYEIVAVGGEDEHYDSHDYSINLRSTATGKDLAEFGLGGYLSFEDNLVDPTNGIPNHRVLWRPDSKFAAIRSRGTRHSYSCVIADVTSPSAIGLVDEEMPHYWDYISQTLNDKHGGYVDEDPLKWRSPNLLELKCWGTIGSYSASSDTYYYRFLYEVKHDENSSTSVAIRTVCDETTFTALDQDLNVQYKETLGNLDAEARVQLIQAQRDWISMRDAHCKSYSSDETSQSRVDCLTSLTEHRLEEIRDLAKAKRNRHEQ